MRLIDFYWGHSFLFFTFCILKTVLFSLLKFEESELELCSGFVKRLAGNTCVDIRHDLLIFLRPNVTGVTKGSSSSTEMTAIFCTKPHWKRKSKKVLHFEQINSSVSFADFIIFYSSLLQFTCKLYCYKYCELFSFFVCIVKYWSTTSST